VFAPSSCRFTADVYDSNGYSKSLCYIFLGNNYDGHRLYSNTNGMRLFKMDSAVANSTLVKVFTTMWPWSNYFIFVGNRDGSGCNSLNYVKVNGSQVLRRENCNNYNTATYEFINIERNRMSHLPCLN
jgi:hypothetical protein